MTERMEILLEKVDNFLESDNDDSMRLEISSMEKSVIESHLKEAKKGKDFHIFMGIFKPGQLIQNFYLKKR